MNQEVSRSIVFTILAAISIMLVIVQSGQPNASGGTDQTKSLVESVSGDRIMSTVSDLQDFGSRAYSSSSMWNASIYIHERFSELGLFVTYQDFVVMGYPQRNVIAVLNGTDPAAPQYLFGAHYDSMTMDIALGQGGYLAPGADDDASGIAAVIELATVLRETEFNCTVKFVAFGAEETGLNGSFEFVKEELREGVVYADTAVMDMIGYRMADENEATIFRGTDDNTLSKATRNAVDRFDLNLTLTQISGKQYAFSDHFPFWLAGYPSMMIIEELSGDWPANPYYHTENDTASRLSEEQMTVIAQAILGGFLDLQYPEDGEGGHTLVLVGVGVLVAVTVAVVITIYFVRRGKVAG